MDNLHVFAQKTMCMRSWPYDYDSLLAAVIRERLRSRFATSSDEVAASEMKFRAIWTSHAVVKWVIVLGHFSHTAVFTFSQR